MPSRSLVPRAPEAPVMAPKKPMVALQPPAPPPPEALETLELFFELLQAAIIVADTAIRATMRRSVLRSGIHCLLGSAAQIRAELRDNRLTFTPPSLGSGVGRRPERLGSAPDHRRDLYRRRPRIDPGHAPGGSAGGADVEIKA